MPTEREQAALDWADGEGFHILTELGVRDQQWDEPRQNASFGMDCDPRRILELAYLALVPEQARENAGPDE